MSKLTNPTSLSEILNEKIKYASEDAKNYYVIIDDPIVQCDNRLYVVDKKTGAVSLEYAMAFFMQTAKKTKELTDPYSQMKLSK